MNIFCARTALSSSNNSGKPSVASSIRAPWPRDYYMVAILDRPANLNYSSRAAGAAYCVADVSTEAFRRFHVALFARQPSETAATFPTDTQLAETARQAGADDADCIISERYSPMVQSLAQATGIKSTRRSESTVKTMNSAPLPRWQKRPRRSPGASCALVKKRA